MRGKSTVGGRRPRDDIGSLVVEFVESVEKHGVATETGKRGEMIREYRRYDGLRKQFLVLGKAGEDAIRGLMSHENGWVRMVAASTCLSFAREEAERVLEALQREPGFLGHDARWVLKEWRARQQ